MNYMKQVAQMIGVELNEEFLIEGVDERCKITEDGFFYYDEEGGWQPSMCILDVLEGKRVIEKLPWKPKKGEDYWSFIRSLSRKNEWVAEVYMWYDSPCDWAMYNAGMVFKSKEEAMDALPRVYKELTGEDYQYGEQQ